MQLIWPLLILSSFLSISIFKIFVNYLLEKEKGLNSFMQSALIKLLTSKLWIKKGKSPKEGGDLEDI